MVNPPVQMGIMTYVLSRYRIGKLRILSGHCRIHLEAPGVIPMMEVNAAISPSLEGLLLCG